MFNRRQITVGAGVVAGACAAPVWANAQDDWAGTLSRAMPAIETRFGARLGVTVLDAATGRRMSHRGSERFAMCSTFKTLAAAAVLGRVDAGQDDLKRVIRFVAGDLVTYSPVTSTKVNVGMTLGELCEAATTLSDNTAANLMLQAIGGPSGVTAFARSVGDPATRLDRAETALNEATPGDPRDTTTPDAMAATLRAIVLGDALSLPSRQQITAWLIANKTGEAKLRAGLPREWRIGDRTGAGGHGTTNHIAVIWPTGRAPLVVTVFLTQTKAPLAETNAAFVDIGKRIAAAFAA